MGSNLDALLLAGFDEKLGQARREAQRIHRTLVEGVGVQVGPYTRFSPVVEPFGTSACFYIVKWYQIEL